MPRCLNQMLTLNNQQWLICHKTKPNQSNPTPLQKIGYNRGLIFKLNTAGLMLELSFPSPAS